MENFRLPEGDDETLRMFRYMAQQHSQRSKRYETTHDRYGNLIDISTKHGEELMEYYEQTKNKSPLHILILVSVKVQLVELNL